MKQKYHIAALAALLAVVGCDRTQQPGPESQPNAPVPTNQPPERPKDSGTGAPPVKDSVVVPPPMIPAPSQNAPPPSTSTPTAPGQSAAPPAFGQKDAPVAKDNAPESKADFIATMDKKLKDLDVGMAELSQKAMTYTDEAKVQADQALGALREQRDKVSANYEELKTASAEAWTEFKVGFIAALDDLEKAFENAKSKFT